MLVTVWLGATLVTLPKVFLTRDAALARAFGDEAEVTRRTVFLSERQVAAGRELAGPGIELRSAMVVQYVGRLGDRLLGTAYFDTHRVRTLQETLMVVVDAEGKVASVTVLTFDEPENYLPRDAWYRQFDGRGLDEQLALKRGVHGITGATLSAEATTDAVRRVLAVHAVIEEARR
ncbi:MAG TPA: FMN-binding protein [Candidatus Polarisedimenticolaceae bacterium]|nr:FMN-binding protein [Candidatus Polarisedimenticolaceae bacterium]